MSDTGGDAPVDTPTAPSSNGGASPEPKQSSPTKAGAPKANQIRTVSQLLVYAYSRHGRSFNISASVVKALEADSTDHSVLFGEIEQLAETDPLLGVPPRLLSAIERARVRGRLRKALLGLVDLPLVRHPAFTEVDFGPAAPEDVGVDRANVFRSIRVHAASVSAEQLGRSILKPADRRTLESNAVLTAALLLALREDWPSAVLARVLDEALWQEALSRTKSRSERALLVDAASPGILGLVANLWRDETRRARVERDDAYRERNDALASRDTALAAAATLAAESERLEDVVKERDRALFLLEERLTAERDARHVDKSHAIDDFENLRTQTVRTLDRQTALLEDGLHALRHGSVQVTDEYVDRAIEALRKESERLRGGPGGSGGR